MIDFIKRRRARLCESVRTKANEWKAIGETMSCHVMT